MKKRILAVVLSVIMLFNIIPATATANDDSRSLDGNYQEIIVGGEEGGQQSAPGAQSDDLNEPPVIEDNDEEDGQQGAPGAQSDDLNGLPVIKDNDEADDEQDAPGTSADDSNEAPETEDSGEEDPAEDEQPADMSPSVIEETTVPPENLLMPEALDQSDFSVTTTADGDTRYTYQSIFDDNNTRYDGRIWTDKSVLTDDKITYTGNVHESGTAPTGSVTISKDEGEDFLVSYSALASTTSVIDQSQSPIDMVLVLDLSPMSNSTSGKAQALLNAVKSAIDAMMEANPENRVAVVTYSSQAEVLLPLGVYRSVEFEYSGSATQQSTVTCRYVSADGKQNEPKTFTIANNRGSGVNKYTQMGIYTGMQILAQVQDTTIAVGDDTVVRQPVLILLSEGEPKIASTNITAPTKSLIPAEGWSDFSTGTAYTSEQNTGGGVEILRNYGKADDNVSNADNDNRRAQTFATLLTAAYMKKQVTNHYFSSDNSRQALVYTVGIRTSSANSPGLAQIVLDPTNYLVPDANQFSGDFIGYATSYFEGDSVAIPDAGINRHKTNFSDNQTLGLSSIDDLKYNDLFFNVTGDGSNLNFGDIFGDILTDIISSAAQGSTHVDNNVDPTQGGYLTYTDPIGEYMEVKDVKAMIINDVIYRRAEKRETSGTTTYVFTGMANNPVYGAQELRHIIIQVNKENEQETLEVKIPAALLPLRLTTILKDNDGNVVRYAHNSAYPFRLIYSVGLQEGVLNDDSSVNMKKVSDKYIADHTVDGKVQFYEGKYSGTTEEGNQGGRTIGDAYVTYVPALNNPFYYVTEDTPLYVLGEGANLTDGIQDEDLVQATDPFDENTTYYFKISYYVAASEPSKPAATKISQWISRPGSSIREVSVDRNDENQLYLKNAAPRLGNLNDFLREKGEDNKTGTAQIYLYLKYTGDEEADHSFQVHHGNNGRLSAPLPKGTLSITKQVVNGERAPTKKFKFKITLQHTDNENHEIDSLNDVTFNEGVGEFTLSANETKIFNISQDHNDGVSWSVEEITTYDSDERADWSTTYQVNNGEAISGKKASGTLMPGGSQAVTFTNTYTTPTGTLTVGKVVNGDVNYADTTNFSFKLTLTGLKEGDTVLSNGESIELEDNNSYIFSLADKQSCSFTIPANVTWKVEETTPLNGNWATLVSETDTMGTSMVGSENCASGTIKQSEHTTVGFTNTYTAPGALLISKAVEGAPENDNQSYSFTVELKDKKDQPIDGTFGDVTFKNGMATISLAGGESQTIQNLTAGTQWTVEETGIRPDDWTTTVNGKSGSVVSGEIQSGELSTAAFVNSAPGTLTVSKKVEGGTGTTEQFKFTVTYGNTTENFMLANGASKKFTLPAGTRYTVQEDNPGANWSTTVNGESGSTAQGTILAGVTDIAAFVNTYQETPVAPEPNPGGETGGNHNSGSTTTYVTLHYESNGGTEYADEQYRQNTLVDLDKVPTKEGYTFTGWYADAALTEPIDDIRMTSDKTVYAGWKATGIPDMLNGRDHFAYVIGYADGTVRPLEHISRAEVATIIFRLLDPKVRDENLTSTNTFEDVSEDVWYNTAISTLAKLGIVYGRTSETTFAPNASITRAEFAAICARFDHSGIQVDSNFTDISGHWAADEIERAATLGWIRGYSDGTFRPDNQITRAEAMTMINRVLQRLPENEDDLLQDMNVWPDNQPEDWYYLAVQEATNSHDFNRKGDGVHEHWIRMIADPDWKQYT